MTDENFDDFISKNESALVFFSAPWCGHCLQMEPMMNLLVERLQKSKHNIPLGLILENGEKTKLILGRYGVSNFPTIALFFYGEPVLYQGARVDFDIYEWVLRILFP